MMNKISAFVCVIAFNFCGFSQDFSSFLVPLADNYDLTQHDINAYQISSAYVRRETKMQHVYLQQTVNEIPVFNALMQLHIHDGNKLIFHNSTFIPNAASRIDASSPQLDLNTAFTLVSTHLKLDVEACFFFS